MTQLSLVAVSIDDEMMLKTFRVVHSKIIAQMTDDRQHRIR